MLHNLLSSFEAVKHVYLGFAERAATDLEGDRGEDPKLLLTHLQSSTCQSLAGHCSRYHPAQSQGPLLA